MPSWCWRAPTRRTRPPALRANRISRQDRAILATRRRRSLTEPEIWAAHLAVVEGEAVGERETERARFSAVTQVRSPLAVLDGRRLLSALFRSCFRRVRSARPWCALLTVVASSRGDVLDLDKHHDTTVELATWRGPRRRCSHLGVGPDQASLFQCLAGACLRDPSLRLVGGHTRQRRADGAWAQGISGDLPVVLVRINIETSHRPAAAGRP
jgi:cyclic beta-1,2-glucan synthetase